MEEKIIHEHPHLDGQTQGILQNVTVSQSGVIGPEFGKACPPTVGPWGSLEQCTAFLQHTDKGVAELTSNRWTITTPHWESSIVVEDGV
jgi:hypothetical protein